MYEWQHNFSQPVRKADIWPYGVNFEVESQTNIKSLHMS